MKPRKVKGVFSHTVKTELNISETTGFDRDRAFR